MVQLQNLTIRAPKSLPKNVSNVHIMYNILYEYYNT